MCVHASLRLRATQLRACILALAGNSTPTRGWKQYLTRYYLERMYVILRMLHCAQTREERASSSTGGRTCTSYTDALRSDFRLEVSFNHNRISVQVPCNIQRCNHSSLVGTDRTQQPGGRGTSPPNRMRVRRFFFD